MDFVNKHGQVQTDNWFSFEYEVGHRLNSNEPRCYQSVYMPPAKPACKFMCKGRECFLKGPTSGRKRMLIGADGRPDESRQISSEFERRFLQKLSGPDNRAVEYAPGYEDGGLSIPTKIINKNKYFLPEEKMDRVLLSYID